MSGCECDSVEILEDSSFLLLAYVEDLDGDPLTPSQVASITWVEKAKSTGTEISSGTVATIADVIKTPVVTDDPRWTRDERGYNFRFVGSPSYVPEGGETYQFDFEITTTVGEGSLKIPVVFDVVTKDRIR